MSVDREEVRALVREELVKRIGHPALLLLHLPEDQPKDLEPDAARPCVIEPDRPCYQSGYCKRLGY
ncbi:MAG TPA: hypothetical protein VIG29_00735 [Vicinamibacteria bacterium]|jgi:hypothetical protein